MLHPRIQEVTQRVIERSKNTRQDYLDRISHAKKQTRVRAGLGCGNIAHVMAACSSDDKARLKADEQPNLAIINSYNDMLSAHVPYKDYPDLIKDIATKYDATAQVAGGVPAMCDGVTQGRDGMELSLFSRDVIAMSTAISLSHDVFDGVFCLGVCDKIVPGLLIGALSFGHLPVFFLPAGPMQSGIPNKEKARIRQKFAQGLVSREDLLEAESASYHSAGTCTFYGTANSNQMLMEIMGLHLPGSSFINPYTELRDGLTGNAVETMLKQLTDDKESPCLADVISEKTIINGLVGLLSTGGSTNHAIHIVAIAKAAGIQVTWKDMSDLSEVVPLLTRIYPNGSADVNHFQAAGGMGFLMRELASAGYLHTDVKTMLGDGLAPYMTEPRLDKDDSLIMSDSTGPTKVKWVDCPANSHDEEVLRPVSNPFSKQGGLQLLTGNLGKAVIKVSAVAEEHQTVTAPAKVFSSQSALQDAYTRGELNQDFIAVLKEQGPKAKGMPELHKLTPVMATLQDEGFKVAIVTDGRMSGASGKVPAAIHLAPEAVEGGIIAKIREGDLVTLDAPNGILKVHVSDEELAKREAELSLPSATFGTGRELFTGFRNIVSSADLGASAFGLE
ncbi:MULTISPECIES: phosphogluconate dehydratase [Pseudoalteromonas]|jgi:phosphogluconate dehydratase|uniref:Phosphogluconate dehydratase n=2 Tax=Pseudoalteromonas TaxID=53246 RepID=F3BJ42_9GAMM|nr:MULTISPECIES: phosphogluconate dehydratase [Pseudoalteromonas]EGI73460.1 phosphogluconate dehydratase [Pseudoalteromonas distincta]KAA1160466.1 phosphogluconate dehydratase [Pseudoalteromonas distincta]MBB1297116.1 phosphogluconate dehydratase [Pseudoalteromonas sp. SR41-7]MBB1338479.1 phosphogluconate dehydratase [Pseudoalteromonas sp. SR44-2]MBB1400595.1 phosphogluconate dehydratase [Pseudoalteromonas sp. SG45-1]|tara:strand:+ start:56377 stop:58227 length:1851 start_codon:yes stop_codon:yes gene_type:complete